MDVLPEDVATEVRDRKNVLNSTDKVLLYISDRLARYRDKELSSMHDKRAEHALDHAPRNPVNAIVETEKRVNDMMSKMESMVAAFSTAARDPSKPPKLDRPDPKFEGCWHCGAKGHTRRECRTFKDVPNEWEETPVRLPGRI